MRTYHATITRQGQVTIQAETRRELGLHKPGKVPFVVEDGVVQLKAPAMTIDEFLGSIPGRPGTPADLGKEIEAAISEALHHLGPGARPRSRWTRISSFARRSARSRPPIG